MPNGIEEDLWYKTNVTLTAIKADGYLLAKDTWKGDNVFSESITISTSTNETQIYYKNETTGIISM